MAKKSEPRKSKFAYRFFTSSPRQLRGMFYRDMRKVHKDRIDALKKIASKPGRLTKRDDQKIREHLKEISQNTYKEMREASSDMNAMGFAKEKALFKTYEQYFGHPIPNLEKENGKLKADALCVGNTIAQNKLLKDIGNVGSLTMGDTHADFMDARNGHMVPTVRIKGKTYVIEQNGVYTPKEYFQGLVEAYNTQVSGKKHPLVGVANSLFKGATPKKSDFARRIRYMSEKGAIASAYTNMGATHYSSLRFDDAEEAYRKAMKADSKYARAHYELGSLLLSKGKMDEGLRHMKKASRLHKAAVRYPNEIASYYSVEGNHAQAIKYLKETLKRDRKNPNRYKAVAEELMKMGKHSQAMTYLEKAIEVSPDLMTHLDVGEIAERMPSSKRKDNLMKRVNEKASEPVEDVDPEFNKFISKTLNETPEIDYDKVLKNIMKAEPWNPDSKPLPPTIDEALKEYRKKNKKDKK